MNVAPKYFDYLEAYGDVLSDLSSGSVAIASTVRFCRTMAASQPDIAVDRCRVIIEKMLQGLLGEAANHLRLSDIIDVAYDGGIIDKKLWLQLNEIRRIGNMGAHGAPVKVVEAKATLELLDDVLRWFVINRHIDPDLAPEVPRGTDEMILTIASADGGAKLAKRAGIASSISGDASLEARTRSTVTVARRMQSALNAAVDDLGGRLFDLEPSDLPKLDTRLVSGLAKKADQARERVEQANDEVEEILNEHDYIHKLLKGDKHSTDRQFEVMAFPRTQGAVTNVLQIAGAAGTGKTLCLVAKLLMEVRDQEQTALWGDHRKRALFVCFNKNLASYVRSLLDEYPDGYGDIEVESYDNFVNQLVRNTPKTGYEHLAEYATDVRYAPRMMIEYSGKGKPFVCEAMDAVAERHPDLKDAYYLDASLEDNVDWVNDELIWLEARYEDFEQAHREYPDAPRTGRGTSRRPDASVRKVIMEVWESYDELLAQKKRYTIDQATKRLMASDMLPHYDAIAVDEAQDFTVRSIQLLLKLRRSSDSRMYISGDENQKIYQRDFTWRELDSSAHGYTITLTENKRNRREIRLFSERLLGQHCSHDEASNFIHVTNADIGRVLALIRNLRAKCPHDTIALISNAYAWREILEHNGIQYMRPSAGVSKPGFYLVGALSNKGLEFDDVIVDMADGRSEVNDDDKRLRYVHFTRARQRLYVRYDGRPPSLMREYYADYLPSKA